MTSRQGPNSHRERFDYSDHSQQSHSNQSQRDKRREQKAQRQQAVKEVENHFTQLSMKYILGESDELNLSDEHGSGVPLKKGESLQRYLGRISSTMYQKLYNKLMNHSQVGSSYSFNKRTSGNALDSNGIVFMKDLDVDHISKQAISIAFQKQLTVHQQEKRVSTTTNHTSSP